MWNLGEPGAWFPAAARNHAEALFARPQAFQAVGEQPNPNDKPVSKWEKSQNLESSRGISSCCLPSAAFHFIASSHPQKISNNIEEHHKMHDVELQTLNCWKYTPPWQSQDFSTISTGSHTDKLEKGVLLCRCPIACPKSSSWLHRSSKPQA